MVSPRDGRVDQVERRIAELSAALQAATGGAPLCRRDDAAGSAAGGPGSAKQVEGRISALREARLALQRDPGTDLADLVDRWRADLGRRAEQGAAAAWQEYLLGGVEELEGVRSSAIPS